MQNERPESFNTLTDWLRWRSGALVTGTARLIVRLGLGPNAVTVIGLVLAVVAGWLAAQGYFIRAGIVYALGGSFDALDGAVARIQGRVSRFGAVLDSTLDRYGEGALLAGLGYWLARSERLLDLMLVFAILAGSFLVSYVRARAEGLGLDLKIGLLTRFERFVIVLLTLFSGQITIGLAVMAMLVTFTVLQRLAGVYRLTRDE